MTLATPLFTTTMLIVILYVLVFMATIVVMIFKTGRERDKKRYTFDLILNTINDEYFIASYNVLLTANDEAEWSIEQKNSASVILNRLQHISMTIENRITDEKIIKEMLYGVFVASFKLLFPVISDIRNRSNNNKAYSAYENIVFKWKPEIDMP